MVPARFRSGAFFPIEENMDRLFRILVTNRVAVIVVLAAISGVAAWGVTRLRFDDDPRTLLRTSDPEYAQLESVFKEFGSDDDTIVAVLETDDFFTVDRLAALRAFNRAVAERPEVRRLYSMLDGRRPGPGMLQLPLVPESAKSESDLLRAREAALANSLVRGQVLSDDGRTALVLVFLNPEGRSLSKVTEVLQSARTAAHETLEPVGMRVRFTGVPVIREELVRTIQRETFTFNGIAALAATLVTLLILKHPGAVATALWAPGLGAFWMLGFLGVAGLPINVLSCIVPTLIMTVGLSDSIHLVHDLRRRYAATRNFSTASLESLRQVGSACGVTALTTAVGFSSLALTSSPAIREFGLLCAVGSVIVFFATTAVVPTVAWLFLPRHDARTDSWLLRQIESRTAATVDFSLRHRRTAAWGGAALLVGCIAVGLRLVPDAKLTENLAADSESLQALKTCDRVFGGMLFGYVVVTLPEGRDFASAEAEAAVRAAQAVFDRRPETRNSLSLANVVDGLPNLGRDWSERVRFLTSQSRPSLERFVSIEARRALVSAHVAEIGTRDMAPLAVSLAADLDGVRRQFPDIEFEITGTAVVGAVVVNRMIGDLGSSLGLEAAIIGLLTAWAFRSWRLGFISLLPNLFPLAAVAAVLVFTGAALQLGNVIVFNICLGLAVDDTVHVLSKLARESGDDTHGDIRRSFVEVAVSVATTTLILAVGFGVSMLSHIPALQMFGALACVTIAASFIAELIFLPAMLSCWGHQALGNRRRRAPAAAEAEVGAGVGAE